MGEPDKRRNHVSTAHPAKIRAAQPTDVAAVTAIVNAAYEPYVARIGRQPAPMTTDYEQAITAGTVWVLALAEHPVGVIVLHQNIDHLLIENVAVAPQHQGTGSGSQLLLYAEQQAATYGLPQIRLYTNAHMNENLAYYQKRGFVETNRRTDEGYARVFFTKTVVPAPD